MRKEVAFQRNNTLDLHTLLEDGGNDPSVREQVIEVIAWLSQQGFLEERGNDFYTLTDQGIGEPQ